MSRISEMMLQLYGADEAKIVAARCAELDPWFGQYVQDTVCDIIWQLPPLNLFEKSLATIVALSTLQKEEQLQIHIKGFYNLGGSFSDLEAVFAYLLQQGYVESTQLLLNVLDRVQHSEKSAKSQHAILDAKNKALIDLTSVITLGNNEVTKKLLEHLLQEKTLTEEEIRGVLRHATIYCGCPCAMNGFAMLKLVL